MVIRISQVDSGQSGSTALLTGKTRATVRRVKRLTYGTFGSNQNDVTGSWKQFIRSH
jgi:hypothetical protein